MTEISRHIERVLLDNSCVIVPRLGGFVAHDVPASYDEAEGKMYPPRRKVGFNPRLSLNDGLLVQSYMQEQAVGYYEACGLIDRDVAALKERIREQGCCEIGRIGTLSAGRAGAFEFAPADADGAVPELYGLPAFHIEKMGEEQFVAAGSVPSAGNDRPHPQVASRRRREVANYAAAAVVALICYFAWALPNYRDAGKASEAAVPGVEAAKVAAPSPPPSPSRPVIAPTTKNAAPVKAEAAESASAPRTSRLVETPKPFTLVLATAVPQANAEAFIAKLAAGGCAGAEVKHQNKLLYVVYGRYASQMEAWRALKDMQKSRSEFGEAWILKLVNSD